MKTATFGFAPNQSNISDIKVALTIDAAISTYVDTVESLNELSSNTLKHYHHDLKLFARFIRRHTSNRRVSIDSVRPDHIREFIQYMQQRGNAGTSQRRRLSALRGFFEKMVAWGHVEADPTIRLQTVSKKKKYPVVLTESECVRLLEGAKTTRYPVRDHAIFRLFLVSGCTLSELIRLKISDIDLKQRTIRLCGRGNVWRTLKLSKATRDVIKNHLHHRALAPAHPHALFLNRHGQPITKGAIYHAFELALMAANIHKPGLNIHSLRHTSLASLWRSGVSVHIIQRIAGHRSIATTRGYSWAGSRPEAPRPWRWVHPLEESLNTVKTPYSARITGFFSEPIFSISQTIVSPGFR